MVARDDIDVIDIAAPNNVHHEIAIAAAKAGKEFSAKSLWLSTAKRVKKWFAKWKKQESQIWYGITTAVFLQYGNHGQGDDR